MLKNQRSARLLSLLKVSLALYVVSLLTPICSNAQDQTGGSNGTFTLQAEVSHDARLPAVPTNLRAGKRFDPDQLKGLTPNNNWYQLPNWLVGRWHGDTVTVTSMQDCRTGRGEREHIERREVVDTIYGHQRDRNGGTWQYLEVPRVVKMSVDNGVCYLRCLREDVLQSNDSSLVLKLLNNQITLGRGNRIVESDQVQQFLTTLPVEAGLVQTESSLKNFDANGNPLQIETIQKVLQRVGPYEEQNTMDDLNLKQLFVEFLMKIGRPDLLPAVPGS